MASRFACAIVVMPSGEYLSALALFIIALISILGICLVIIRAEERRDVEVDEAHGAPEGAMTDFYFDPEKDGGYGK